MAALAADADTRAVDFGEAVDVVVLHAERVNDALADLLARTLGARDELLELDLVLDAALLDLLGQQERIARSSGQHGGLHVDHELQLLLGVARAHGDGHGAEALATRLEADSRSPQAIARRDLHAVLRRDARKLVAARELDGPVVHVLLGIRDDDRRTGGA